MRLYLTLTSVWGVYLALAVFAAGMAWRVWRWVATPRSPVPLGLFPKPQGASRVRKLLADTFIAPQSARIEPTMWLFAMVFHVGALAAFVGHLRLLHEFTPLVTLLGKEGTDAFAAWAGGAAGTAMLVGVLYWIARRTFGPFKRLSVPEDYLLLFLLLLVIVMGDHMRFFGDVHGPTYMAWFRSLLAFRPEIPEEILSSTTGWSLGTHMLFVDLFLVYFPFSKLVHAIGAFSSNLTRSA